MTPLAYEEKRSRGPRAQAARHGAARGLRSGRGAGDAAQSRMLPRAARPVFQGSFFKRIRKKVTVQAVSGASVPFRAAKAATLLAAVLLAAVPAVATLWLVQHSFDSSLTAFCPAYDVDQYMYVREARTFAAVGFDSGFYGSNGQVARIGRFGPHGPAYAVVYGGLARLFGGWQDWLAPALNLGLVSLALLAVGRRLPLGRFAAIVGLVLLFPSTLLYLPLSYQEAPQYAVALLLALGLARLVAPAGDEPRDRGRVWGVLVGVLLASLTRPTWAVLFPAVVYCATPGRWRDIPIAAALGGGLLVGAYALFSLGASPWNVQAGSTVLLSLLHGDPGPLLARLVGNVQSLLNFTDNAHHSLELAIMLGGTILAMVLGRGRTSLAARRAAALHLCNMFVPFLVYIVVYNGSGYQLNRLLSAHFLLGMTLALLVAPTGTGRLVLAPVLAGCLALLPAALGQYTVFVRPAYDDYFGWRGRIDALALALDPALQLARNAPSPWLRTLIVQEEDVIVPSLAALPEYGIQVYSRGGLDTPFRAGFALLDAAGYATARRATPLTPLATTPRGVLYRNDAAFGFAPAPGTQP